MLKASVLLTWEMVWKLWTLSCSAQARVIADHLQIDTILYRQAGSIHASSKAHEYVLEMYNDA